MDKTKKEDLLGAGYVLNRIKEYVGTMNAENLQEIYNKDYREWAHSKGFWVRNACYYNLDENNLNDYLSDYDYQLVWPLNDWERIWINDKLTLKLILEGTKFNNIMPKYYYYSTPKGLCELVDNNNIGNSDSAFLMSLQSHRVMACKPNNGSFAQGFYKLSFFKGNYFINDDIVSEKDIISFVRNHPNYIYTEYLIPSNFFSKFSPLIHTIRINVLNIHGDDPVVVGEWVRIPTKQTTIVNNASLETSDKYNLITKINVKKGDLEKSYLAYADRIVETKKHPDTGLDLSGHIEDHEAIIDFILSFCRKYNTLEWMGFDIGVTPNGFKCMEINSHPGIMYDQMFTPWMKDPMLKDYFVKKIKKINNLTLEEKRRRNKIQR